LRAFDDASRHSVPALEEDRALTRAERLGLGNAIQQLDMAEITSTLAQNNLSIYTVFLAGVLDKLSDLQSAQSGSQIGLSASDVKFALQIFDQLCFVDGGETPTSDAEKSTHGLGLITFTFSGVFNVASSPDVRAYFNLSLVFFLLLGLISLITLVWKIYAISLRFMARRKTCKIPAVLRLLDLTIEGHITLLDKRSARFSAEDEDGFKAMIDYLKEQPELPVTKVAVKGSQFLTTLVAVAEKSCVTRFETVLDRTDLEALFAQSLEPTRDALRGTIKPNMSSINPKFA